MTSKGLLFMVITITHLSIQLVSCNCGVFTCFNSQYCDRSGFSPNCAQCSRKCTSGFYAVGCGSGSPGTCRECNSCVDGFYRFGCGGTNEGLCINCGSCNGVGQFRIDCSGTNPGSCVNCPDCQSGFYRSGCGVMSSGECVRCESCPNGQKRIECSNLDSGRCIAESTAGLSTQETTQGTAQGTNQGTTQGTQSANSASTEGGSSESNNSSPKCDSDSYELVPETETTTRICRQLTICELTAEYILREETLSTDRICQSLTDCEARSLVEKYAPTATSDRICETLTQEMSSNSSNDLSAILPAVLGSALVLMIVIIVAFYIIQSRRKNTKKQPQEQHQQASQNMFGLARNPLYNDDLQAYQQPEITTQGMPAPLESRHHSYPGSNLYEEISPNQNAYDELARQSVSPYISEGSIIASNLSGEDAYLQVDTTKEEPDTQISRDIIKNETYGECKSAIENSCAVPNQYDFGHSNLNTTDGPNLEIDVEKICTFDDSTYFSTDGAVKGDVYVDIDDS
eukprot:gene5352-7105_t